MAGIIKSGVWHGTTGTVSPSSFNFEDMSSRADTYLASIRRQAADILAAAKNQVAAVEAEACNRGRQAAKEQAERFAKDYVDQRLKTLLPALEQSITAIQHSRESWLRHWEQNTIHLATAIAERLIRRELSQSPEISLEWMRQALELATGGSRVALHLNPNDLETLGERVQELTTRLAKVGEATIVSDPAIEPGGCRVVTEFGSIDHQLSAQLKRIEEDLVG